MLIPKDYTTSERHLTYLMRIYAFLFGIFGFLFLLFPWHTLNIIDWLSQETFILWIGLPHEKVNAQATSAEYFWVFLSFSMMITISACSYIASKDVRRNRPVIVPVILAKLSSALSAIAFYISSGVFAHFVIFLSDFPLFLLTLYFYLKGHTGGLLHFGEIKEKKTIVKILMVMGLATLALVCAVLAGYTNYLEGYVISLFAVMLALCVRLCHQKQQVTLDKFSFNHLLGLIVFGFIIGFFSEAIGITSNMWFYTPTPKSLVRGFISAVLLWSLAAITMEYISRFIRSGLSEITGKPINVLMIITIFAAIPIALSIQDQLRYAHIQFWVYYTSLLIFSLAMHYHISFTELLSLILSAWIMGGIGNWIGATAKLWHFRTQTSPPLFLVLSCWPLEFLVIRGLALNAKRRGVRNV